MSKEHPILFLTPMVRAILEGRKTQTRRIMRFEKTCIKNDLRVSDEVQFRKMEHRKPGSYGAVMVPDNGFPFYEKCPFGMPGDVLWVRETWRKNDWPTGWPYEYKATAAQDGTPVDGPWKPPMFMPREACRIMLKVEDVRVERLQDITEEDAIAEGVESWIDERLKSKPRHYKLYYHDPGDESVYSSCPILSYESLWKSIHGPDSWEKNPWVWVIKFSRI